MRLGSLLRRHAGGLGLRRSLFLGRWRRGLLLLARCAMRAPCATATPPRPARRTAVPVMCAGDLGMFLFMLLHRGPQFAVLRQKRSPGQALRRLEFFKERAQAPAQTPAQAVPDISVGRSRS